MRKSGLGSGAWAGVLMVGAMAGAAGAAPVTVNGIRASKDATLFETPDGAQADGQGPNLYVGKSGAGGGETRRRALMQFDLSAIPTSATINSVTLTLHASQTGFSGDPAVTLHRVTTNWGEGPSTGFNGRGAAPAAGDSTWVHTFFNTQTWTTPGGDFVAAGSGSAPVVVGVDTVLSSAQMASDVQAWVASPGQNFGWILTGDEVNSGSAARLFSDEGTSPPTLSVTYDLPAVPEPAGVLAVFAIAPWLVSRRGRRR